MLDLFLNIVAAILLFLPILNWIPTYLLRQVANQSGSNTAIKERAFVATILAIVGTLSAILAVNRLIGGVLSPGIPLIILSISLILVSIPNIYWLWLYHKKRLGN